VSGNRAPTTVWGVGLPPNMRAYVRTTDDDMILIAADDWPEWSRIIVTRREARMIAKRINECLDKTKKR